MVNRSSLAIVAAILAAGTIVAGAILLTRFNLFDTTPPDRFHDVKEAVANELFDPGSAKFRNFREKIDGFSYCGEVNGKNKFGGYVGFKRFNALKKRDGGWVIAFDETLVKTMCD